MLCTSYSAEPRLHSRELSSSSVDSAEVENSWSRGIWSSPLGIWGRHWPVNAG